MFVQHHRRHVFYLDLDFWEDNEYRMFLAHGAWDADWTPGNNYVSPTFKDQNNVYGSLVVGCYIGEGEEYQVWVKKK